MASIQLKFNRNNETNQYASNIPPGFNDLEKIIKDSSSDCNNNINHTNLMVIDSPMRRLKKMGWYWGSISPDYASKLLEDEQDGTFLVRDSSSECYIFSMTFKLDGQIHHARIEHCKGWYKIIQSFSLSIHIIYNTISNDSNYLLSNFDEYRSF